jgi:hypothetical protein
MPAKTSSAFQGEHLERETSGTIDASHLASLQQFNTMQATEPGPSADPFQPGGTMLLNEGRDLSELLKVDSVSKVLGSQDIYDSEDRLRHVCHLIKKARLPVCPINGIATTLPFDLIESSSSQLQIAIQKDIAILREEFLVRCPNTALVTGMETEEGFIELIKRLSVFGGADRIPKVFLQGSSLICQLRCFEPTNHRPKEQCPQKSRRW